MFLFLSSGSGKNSLSHCHTLLFFTCYDDTFSLFLFIVTCFAMSFALRSDATARLILDASVLHCTRASPRSSLLVAVHECYLYHSRASSTSGTVSSAAYFWSFSRSFSLQLAGSRSATYNLATALLPARGRASTKSGPCCESSSGSSVLLMSRVESLQFAAQP